MSSAPAVPPIALDNVRPPDVQFVEGVELGSSPLGFHLRGSALTSGPYTRTILVIGVAKGATR